MNPCPSDQLPVCAYDGHCYRKNPQHFQAYSHPLQYPQQQLDTATTAGADEPQQMPSKRCRSEDHSSSSVHGADRQAAGDRALSIQEADLASPAQLLHFLTHAPHLSALVSLDSNNGKDTTGLLHIDVQHYWSGVAQVLEQAYAGMGFHAEDVQCVLTAACALNPANPLAAFRGWRLTGPFELAVRYGQLCSSSARYNKGDADAKAAAEKLKELLHGRNAEDEVRRWRCGRFRYDPPECQTVAMQVTSAGTKNKELTLAQLDAEGVHICFHRDEPSDAPGMLAEGTARRPKFTMLNGKGWLSAYLCAWYRAAGDAESLATAHALQSALDALSAVTKPNCCAGLKTSFAESLSAQRTDVAKRLKACVAPLYSGLGLCVPVDKTTEIGYREPNIPARVSLANCLRDWEADFVAAAASPSTSDDGTHDSSASPATALDSAPYSRSVNFARLREAHPFSAKTSETLDGIFLCADIANDEADFGTSLELGLNCLTCVLADTCVVAGRKRCQRVSLEENDGASVDGATQRACHTRYAEESLIDPVVWHTYRLLDCAYMLLQRPLYRHILRCHLPLLADANCPILLDMHE
ncbi:hypothetical protein ABB37_01597 [Leptomonas pyrrhocoris]|uniref:PBZ-type domain-containing protein n=1 Tax=Leptomonas pyrrhocoris TaxID=157538 RepID=A0A0M9G8Y2_LEPPY|nr:hypothetical protein ABB37_01597 [Leptomonas pyrrhocoris]KPA85250.1 hypothetical protein ABB37_01597 [Leptomonas pyrrhocoris]|eukprot:XP_015663689.1 hypothetical protein ABB37_01597 [Leptomonas pyrrhocoris]